MTRDAVRSAPLEVFRAQPDESPAQSLIYVGHARSRGWDQKSLEVPPDLHNSLVL